MSGLLSDDAGRLPNTGINRSDVEKDEYFDKYFAGARPDRLGIEERRGPDAGVKFIEKYTYNINDRVRRYQPTQRISRKGKQITKNEEVFIRTLRSLTAEQGGPVEWKHIARFLRRTESEINLDPQIEGAKVKGDNPELIPMIDRIWALRYIHIVYKINAVTDATYDNLVQTEIEYGGGVKAFAKIKAHQGWPQYIKALAGYLVDKLKENT